MNTKRLHECNLFRLAIFVLLPALIIILVCAQGNYYKAMICTFLINVLLAAS